VNEKKGVCVCVGVETGLKLEANGGQVKGVSNVFLL